MIFFEGIGEFLTLKEISRLDRISSGENRIAFFSLLSNLTFSLDPIAVFRDPRFWKWMRLRQIRLHSLYVGSNLVDNEICKYLDTIHLKCIVKAHLGSIVSFDLRRLENVVYLDVMYSEQLLDFLRYNKGSSRLQELRVTSTQNPVDLFSCVSDSFTKMLIYSEDDTRCTYVWSSSASLKTLQIQIYKRKDEHIGLREWLPFLKGIQELVIQPANILPYETFLNMDHLGGLDKSLLKKLKLQACKRLNDDALQSLFFNAPNLVELEVFGCDDITEEGLCQVVLQLERLAVFYCAKIENCHVELS